MWPNGVREFESFTCRGTPPTQPCTMEYSSTGYHFCKSPSHQRRWQPKYARCWTKPHRTEKESADSNLRLSTQNVVVREAERCLMGLSPGKRANGTTRHLPQLLR